MSHTYKKRPSLLERRLGPKMQLTSGVSERSGNDLNFKMKQLELCMAQSDSSSSAVKELCLGPREKSGSFVQNRMKRLSLLGGSLKIQADLKQSNESTNGADKDSMHDTSGSKTVKLTDRCLDLRGVAAEGDVKLRNRFLTDKIATSGDSSSDIVRKMSDADTPLP